MTTHQLAADNVRLVTATVARLWKSPRVQQLHDSFDDAIQTGCLALLRAAQGFDPGRNIRFSTYAVTSIMRAVGSRYIPAAEQLQLLPLQYPEFVMDRSDHFDVCESVAETQERQAQHRQVQELLDQLSPWAQQIMRLRFGLDGPECTLEEIGRLVGRSKEAVRNAVNNSLRRLREVGVERREREEVA